ncbi:OLC1v1030501C1 [Oldenlandia corymbosa var. corymbosa]|uniref:OLC1v1030501C1 n=1 Tax=Oldenlandia corymbosa var. corymbosa TaxID=529605 RepID=A0AAV1CG83_OLDCO|nr:OLC1v1030501C1 [Oldenlandia corymbosa var. corymbosa]
MNYYSIRTYEEKSLFLDLFEEQNVFLSVSGPRLFPLKNRRKFSLIAWPSLEELSQTPSSGNIEVEEESLSQDQGLEESNEDFAKHWGDSSDEDSSDVKEIDASYSSTFVWFDLKISKSFEFNMCTRVLKRVTLEFLNEVVNKQLVNFSDKVVCVEQELHNLKQEHEGLRGSTFKEIESMQQDLIQRFIDANYRVDTMKDSACIDKLKIEISTFYGGICEGLESWVESTENLFELLNVTRDSVKISIAIQGLRHIAKNWSVLYLRNLDGSEHNGHDFREAIYNRFWSIDIGYEIQYDLYELVQGDMDVESYIAKFKKLCFNGGSDDLNEVYRWGSSINCISEEFVRVNHLEVNDLSEPYKLCWLHGGMELSVTQSAKVDLRIGDLVTSELLDIVPMTALVELRSLSPWESEHIMFKKRELSKALCKVKDVQQNKKEGTFEEGESSGGKFAVRTWPSLEELSITPSSGNIEIEEELLSQDQGLEESNEDFGYHWSDSSDEDSSDVKEIDASEFVPNSKRLEEI